MLLKTSTLTAPWTIIEGDCKWYARIKALRTLVDVLTEQLNYMPPDPISQVEGEEGTKDEAGGKKSGKDKGKAKKKKSGGKKKPKKRKSQKKGKGS